VTRNQAFFSPFQRVRASRGTKRRNRSEDVGDFSPIDWEFAEAVGVRCAGTNAYSRAAAAMPAEFEVRTRVAQELVEDFVGLSSEAGPARVQVISRQDWVRVNIVGFRRFLDPWFRGFAAAEAERRDPLFPRARSAMERSVRPVSRKGLAVELGLLLGFLSRRVLGQYDLILPSDEEASSGPLHAQADVAHDDTLYYVGPNIRALEQRYGFSPPDFRLWIALHEVTHRTQFTGVPWLQPYFLSLLQSVLGEADLAPVGFPKFVSELAARVKKAGSPADGAAAEGGMQLFFRTEEQRVSFRAMTSLMTLLEGHGNYVMDCLGAEHVKGQARMSAALHQRRQKRGVSRVLLQVMGMEMKAKQYEEGQRFVEKVVELAGARGLDPVWQSPESLPLLPEIRENPQAWIARVAST